MRAKTITGASAQEIRDALLQSMSDGYSPTLAIVFVSIKQDREAICDILRERAIDIIGATSSGEFTNGFQGEGSAVVMLLDLNREYYSILFENIGERELSDVATQVARQALKKFESPGIILCSTCLAADGYYLQGDDLIRSVENVVGPHVNVFGGMAGDDITFTGTYVFTSEGSTDKGIVALVLDEEKVSLQGMAISGWNPVGIVRTATKIEDGWIYTIDDKPALEMYLKYLGMEPTGGEDKYELFKDIGVYYPFQVEGTSDPVMRTPLEIDKQKNAIKLDFEIPQGTKFRFSMPPDFDIVENVVERGKELRNAFQSDAEALLIFSCAGRLNALGPFTKMENDGLSETWNAPMAGFFTYGEYGTVDNRKQEFHSTTCCWVALKEK